VIPEREGTSTSNVHEVFDFILGFGFGILDRRAEGMAVWSMMMGRIDWHWYSLVFCHVPLFYCFFMTP